MDQRVFTWRNAIVAGLSMLALLAVSATGYLGLRVAGIGPFGTLMSRGVLEERDRIVLADIEGHTDDSTLALALTLALRTAATGTSLALIGDLHRRRWGLLRFYRQEAHQNENLQA